jgi:hypothetical protein
MELSMQRSLPPVLGFVLVAAGVVGGAGAPSSSAAAMASYRTPSSIAHDCSTDVTRLLNTWMRRVPDGSALEFRRGACYRVDGTLRLVDRRHLRVRGNNAVLRSYVTPPVTPKVTRQMLLIRGGTDVRVHHLTLRGTNPAPRFDVRREWHPLVEIAGGRDVRLHHLTGRNAWGDFVFVGPDIRKLVSADGTGAVHPRDILVRSSTVKVIGRHGITCIGCERLTVDRNTFQGIGYQVMDIEVEATTWHARDITFSNNSIGGHIALSVLASGDTIGHDVTGVVVEGNTMLTGSPTCAPPIDVRATSTIRSDFVIAGNSFQTLGNAIRIGGVTGAVVRDNHVQVSDAGCSNPHVAVVAWQVREGVLQNNAFPGAWTLVASSASDFLACGNWLSETQPAVPQPCTTA